MISLASSSTLLFGIQLFFIYYSLVKFLFGTQYIFLIYQMVCLKNYYLSLIDVFIVNLVQKKKLIVVLDTSDFFFKLSFLLTINENLFN